MVELVVQILVEVDAEESVFAKSGEDDVVVTARFVSRLQFNPVDQSGRFCDCLLYTSPSPRDQRGSRMPSSA